MTKELTHTLTGTDAAIAKLLEDVKAKFHDDKDTFGRLEFYLAQVMCSDSCSWYAVTKEKIIRIANAMHNDYIDTYDKKRIDSAFRKLARAGFFRGYYGYEGPWGYQSKVRYYELCLDRYDTKEVAA